MPIFSDNIRDYHLYSAVTVLKKNLSDSTHQLSEISFLVLKLQLENGIIGESYLLSFQYFPATIRGALQDLLPLIKGNRVWETGQVSQILNRASEYFGIAGINRWVEGLVNIAMWDGWGKCLNQPLHKIWGTTQDRVNIYGSGGGYLIRRMN